MTTADSATRVEPFFTVSEVARILAVSHRTVRRLIDAGKLGAVRTGPAARAHLRIPRAALDHYVASSSSVAASP